MTEKDLLKKLNSYKNIQPDASWKSEHRDILYKQIMNSSSATETGFSFAKIVNTFKIYSDTFYNGIVKNMGQPVILTSAIVALVFGGGVMSLNASRDTTPGDSLYIAKKISEQTQLAFTFDEKKKAQLNVSFAENRAKEIAQVMLKEKPEEEKKVIVDRLTGDFKKEIGNVKTRIEKIAQDTQKENIDNKEPEKKVEENLFVANLGKGDDGLSIGTQDNETPAVVEDANKTAEIVEEPKEIESTTTIDIVEPEITSATTSEVLDESSSKDMLSEVKELIENEDFDATLEKLDQVSSSFDKEQKTDEGEVKGVVEEVTEEDNATTTEE